MKIYFDGGASPNPGPAEVAIVSEDGSIMSHQMIGVQTNNEAEYIALLVAMETALKLKLKNVEFVGDSMLVVMQSKGSWKVKNERMQALNDEVLSLKKKLPGAIFSWIARDENLAGMYIEDIQEERASERRRQRRDLLLYNQ